MKVKTAIKTVGLSFAGYALASIFADKATLNPLATQVAGFVGAFLGTLATPRRERNQTADGAGQDSNTEAAAEQARAATATASDRTTKSDADKAVTQ